MAVILLLLACVPLALAFHFYYRSTYWSRRGVPSPPCPSLWTGHLEELQRDRNPLKVTEQYKKSLRNADTFGVYEGGHKILVTSNLDYLQDIFVKKFDKFYARKFPAQLIIDHENDELTADVFGSQGEKWKRLRTCVGPMFTHGRLRIFVEPIRDSVENFMNILRNHTDEEYNVVPLLNRLTMDVIQRIAFGRTESHLYGEIEEEFVKKAKTFTDPQPTTNSRLMTFFAATSDFSFITIHLMNFVRELVSDAFVQIKNDLHTQINTRRKERENGQTQTKDFIDLLLDTESEEQIHTDDSNDDLKHLKVVRRMMPNEIVNTCTSFLGAGYDTTANGLGYFMYEMARNQEEQQRLYEEIVRICPDGESISLDSVLKIDYLDWCIKESLRLHPLAAMGVSRRCMETTTVGQDGFEIEKGVEIRADVCSLHFDATLWGERPEEFNPERFSPSFLPSRPSIAFASFGLGPRLCIGMRFALMEEKLAICRIMQEFRVQTTDKTTFSPRGLTVTHLPEMIVRFTKREQ